MTNDKNTIEENLTSKTSEDQFDNSFDVNINMLTAMAGYMVAKRNLSPIGSLDDFKLCDLISEFADFQTEVCFLMPMIHQAAAYVFDEPEFLKRGSVLPFYGRVRSEKEADERMDSLAEQLQAKGMKVRTE